VESSSDLLTWITLGAIFAAVAGFYAWLLQTKSRALWQAMVRLRDNIDRSKRL
jgi:hypothetical protein